jgi:hypothetical protein
LLFLGFLSLGFGAGAVQILSHDWQANHKALNIRAGHIDWVGYSVKRGILYIKHQLFGDFRPGLPQVRLYMPIKSLEGLMENPPDSTKKWRRGFMQYPGGSIERIKVRIRGDNPANWMYKKKSLRIKTRKKRLLGNRRVLNYVVPQSETLMDLYLGFEAAKDVGVLTSKSRLVEMFINDEPYGVLVEYDQPDELFLRNAGQMPVNLYKGEQAHLERQENLEHDLFNNAALWKKVAVGNDLPKENIDDLKYFLGLVNRATNDDDAYKSLKAVAPISVWARFAAYQVLIQNGHNDGFHNQRIMIDPWRGEVHPVVTDPSFLPEAEPQTVINSKSAGQQPRGKLDMDTQSMLRLYNKDAQFIFEKYGLLYDYLIRRGFLKKAKVRVNKLTDLLLISAARDFDLWHRETWPGFPFKSPAEKLRKRLSQYKDQIAVLENWLVGELQARPNAIWHTRDDRFVLTVDGYMPIKNVTVQLDQNSLVPAHIAWDSNGDGVLDPSDTIVPFITDGKKVTINATWLANRPTFASGGSRVRVDYPKYSSIPRATRFEFVSDIPLRVSAVSGQNPFTLKTYALKESDAEGAWPSRRNYPVLPERKMAVQVWSGEVNIKGTQFINEPVRVVAGTRFNMDADSNLVFLQQVSFEGTLASPIIVDATSRAEPFGLIALHGPKTAGSKIRHLHMANGTGGRLLNVQYTGMLNLHNTSDVELSHITLRDNLKYDDMLHIVLSKRIQINSINLTNAHSDGVDVDISQDIIFEGGSIKSSKNDGIDTMSSSVTINNMVLSDNRDKGVSIGEASQVTLSNTIVKDNVVGVESKDGSHGIIKETTFVGNRTQINAYKKNWRYNAGGQIFVSNSRFKGLDNIIIADKNSAIQVSNSVMVPPVVPSEHVIFKNITLPIGSEIK